MKKLKVRAYAKINLTLDILDQDVSGYHRMQTILQEIDLFDELTFEEISEKKIIFRSDDKTLEKDKNNTIFKAIQLLFSNFKQMPSGLKITLKKNIPLKAGFGGGSSDAAATLKAICKLWNIKKSQKELMNLASKIGMDAPFFISGKTAFADHFGEKITLLPQGKKKFFLLLVQLKTKKFSTKNAYAKIDQFPIGQQKKRTDELRKKFIGKNNEGIFELFHNDFDFLYMKDLAELREKLSLFDVKGVICAGAGNYAVCFFEKKKKCMDAFEFLKDWRRILKVGGVLKIGTTDPWAHKIF